MIFGGLLTVVEIALVAYCVLEIVSAPAAAVRGLPRPVWLLLVVLLPLVGGTAWLLLGRPRPQEPAPAVPGRPASSATSPDDDEQFLRSLAERAAEQRRRAERERRDFPDGGPAREGPAG